MSPDGVNLRRTSPLSAKSVNTSTPASMVIMLPSPPRYTTTLWPVRMCCSRSTGQTMSSRRTMSAPSRGCAVAACTAASARGSARPARTSYCTDADGTSAVSGTQRPRPPPPRPCSAGLKRAAGTADGGSIQLNHDEAADMSPGIGQTASLGPRSRRQNRMLLSAFGSLNDHPSLPGGSSAGILPVQRAYALGADAGAGRSPDLPTRPAARRRVRRCS